MRNIIFINSADAYFVMGLQIRICIANSLSPHVRDYFVYTPNQWKTTLQCNVVCHWLGAYTKCLSVLNAKDTATVKLLYVLVLLKIISVSQMLFVRHETNKPARL